jgi:ATP-dependent exoDNAse (exonuclease V) alpha subunit
MATYHVELKHYSRGQGVDVMRHLAYVTGSVIHDTRTGLTHASGDRERVSYSAILLPPNAPDWAVRLSQHPADFWNFRSVSEDRLNPRFIHDASLYFEYVIALPKELTRQQNIELVNALVEQVFHPHGLAVQVSLHGDEGNPHVHLNIADRALTDDGWSKRKHRVYNRRDGLKAFRARVADAINAAYAQLGIDERVTHVSHKDRGLRLEATLHEGPLNDRAHAGIAADNAAIRQRNQEAILKDPSLIITEVATLKNVFTAKDLAQTLLKRLDGDHILFEQVYPQVLSNPELIPLTLSTPSGEITVYTTPAHQCLERQLITTARSLSATQSHALSPTTVDACVAAGLSQKGQGESVRYSDEQLTAIRHLTQGRDLTLLHGQAGTGKTTVLRAVADAYHQSGYTVVGMALSGVAAQNLAQATGIEAKTIHRWMQDWHLNASHRATLATTLPDEQTYQAMLQDLDRVATSLLTERHVVILDEASMVDPHQFYRIMEQVSAAKAKVICVGDTAQLGSVTYGAPFRALKEHLLKECQATLTTVYRQREPWMRAASHTLHQRIDEGLLIYAQKGHITAVSTQDAARDAVAAAYREGVMCRPERSHLALSSTRAGVSQLNRAIRQGRIDDGQLGAYVEQTVTAFGREFRLKDRVVLTQNATRMWVAEGQRVSDAREMGPIYNGDLGTIQVIHVLENQRVVCEVALDRRGIALIDSAIYPHMEYGYAVTVHKSQGMTVDHTYVLLDQGVRQNTAYVALTRHRYGVLAVYSEDQFKDYGALEAHLSKPSYERMTVDYSLDEGAQQIADRLYRYQALSRAMADQRDAGSNRYHPEYRALQQERSKLAIELTEDWSPIHDRLCGQLGLNRRRLYQAAGLRTAYERERDRKVSSYIERRQSLRQEAEHLRAEMGAIPYQWDEPLVQRLVAIQRESDHIAEQLLGYRECRAQITRAGVSWSQLEHQAARSGYRRQANIAYLELSEDNRAKALEVKAFAQEAQLLHWQYQAMVMTHTNITQHMAYDGYAKRQQALNAKALAFVDTLEQVEQMLVREGISLLDLHTRASCHRIHVWTQSSESIHQICLGIAHEMELDASVRDRTLQVQLGLALPAGLQPKGTAAVQVSSLSTSTPSMDIPARCATFRQAWDSYEAAKIAHTLGTTSAVHQRTALRDTQRTRDQAAAELLAATRDRSLTPYSEKQWAAIHAFAAHHAATHVKATQVRRTFDALNQTLSERMPQLCEMLVSERPSQQGSLEWRYGSKGSLKITVAGPKAGTFVNFETGERGDAIQFIATQRQCDRASAIDWARQFVGEVSRTSLTKKTVAPPEMIRSRAPNAIAVEQVSAWVSERPPAQASVPDMNASPLKKMSAKHTETARYTYTDVEGHPLFYVIRFEPKASEPKDRHYTVQASAHQPHPSKLTLPLSYGSEVGSPPEWRFKKYIAPGGAKTPLYNLKELTDSPHTPVLVVEGEKAAEATKKQFPDLVVTTWQGGASAVHLTDWTVLKDREVILWPDNDIAGQKAMNQVQQRCAYAGAQGVTVIDLEFEGAVLPPKWDLADDLPQGLTQEEIQAKITSSLQTLRAKMSIGVKANAKITSDATKTMDWGFDLGD